MGMLVYLYVQSRRVIEEHYPGDEEDIIVKYVYDDLGRLVSVKDGFTNRTTNYSYDAEGHLLCVETRQGNTTVQSIRYRYDEYDQLVGKTTALGTSVTSVEAYTYNAQHLPEQMTVGNLRQIATYNAAGLLTKLDTGTPNSADSIATTVKTDEYAYDSSNNFLTQHEIFISGNTNSDNPDYSYYYQYDSKGNIREIVQSGSSGTNSIIYTYDAANQLIREANPFAGYTWIMTYDDAGNMLSRTKYEYAASYENAAGFQISEQTFTYGKNGWGDVLTGINGTTVASDAIGNIINDGASTYTWKNGRQLATSTKNGVTWTYAYDASGMRTQRSNGSTTYTYTYEGTTLTQMTIGSNTLIFAYGVNGHPMGVKYNGTSYYYVTNAFGDVMAIINESGTEVVTYNYDAWGNILSTGGTMASTLGKYNPFRYRGYVYDQETGLYYLQSRYYNPTICRFISADSIGYLGADGTPVSHNLFAYCGNNPVLRKHSYAFGSTLTTNSFSHNIGDDSAAISEFLKCMIGSGQDIWSGLQYIAAGGVHTKFAYTTNSRYMFPIMGGTWRWIGRSSSTFGTLSQSVLKQVVAGDARAGAGLIAKKLGGVILINVGVNLAFNLATNGFDFGDTDMWIDTAIDSAIGVGAYGLATGTTSLITAGLMLAGASVPGWAVVTVGILLSVGYEEVLREIFNCSEGGQQSEKKSERKNIALSK